MVKAEFNRSEMLLGQEAMLRLEQIRVIVFGMGGVGSWAAETLIRTGLKHLTIVDFDQVATTNINRQLPANTQTVGRFKTDVMKEHLLSINPDAEIISINGLYNEESAADFDLNIYDYVIDAIDSLRDKALLIVNATNASCRLFSSMGAALKTDPTRIRVDEFWKVKGDRLAAALRNKFKRSGVYPARKFKVVWSDEIIENKIQVSEENTDSPINKPIINGSLMQVTAPFGITLASLVINDIVKAD